MNHLTEKYCKKGNHIVSIIRFHKRRFVADGLAYACIDCCKKQKQDRLTRKKEGTIKAF